MFLTVNGSIVELIFRVIKSTPLTINMQIQEALTDTQTRHIKIHTVNVRQISTLHVERFSQIGKIQGC